jgi:hypothetical protein
VSLAAVGVIVALAPQRMTSLLGPVGHIVPALFITARLLQLEMLAVRVLGIVAIGALSFAVVGPTLVDDRGPRAPFATRFARGALGSIDHTLPWLFVAVVVVGYVSASLPVDALAGSSVPAAAFALVIGAGLAGVPLYLCAAGITPVAVALAAHGAPVGAAIALMLTGPSTSFASLRHIRTAHGARAALLIGVVVVAVAFGAGALASVLVGPAPVLPRPPDDDLYGWADRAALAVAGLALLASLYRQGVRGFVEQVLTPAHALEDAHVHGPSCAHDHGASRPPFSRKAPVHTARVALPFDPRSPP